MGGDREGRRPALAGVRTSDDALALFDVLPAVEVDDVLGAWRGTGVPTGHPLDGLLELLGWHGKRFDGADAAHPLLFSARAGGEPLAVDPAGVPVGLVVRASGLLHDERVAAAARRALPLRRTRRPRARLRPVRHRGVTSAAMLYDALPVVDHLRALDDGGLLGLMDARGLERPFFFALHREGRHPGDQHLGAQHPDEQGGGRS
ncbi:GXWXG domain-containing protein [uncultured Pseudokineococcus sp.]|uniref:GXWXG domain-containing protein n=1 Tax=uncultured Pseudokineococcus sp. TaxID=1642928 RepID=UPI0026241C37|nr:GXWXG domain-containing protein [uncultured Pseudokineococcus sp.]